MTADKPGESPVVEVSEWTLFADRHHGRIMIFAKHEGRWYDVTTSSDESPPPTAPPELDSDVPETAEISLRVWRDHVGEVVVAEATIENYSTEKHQQSRLLDSAASQTFEVLFEGDTFLTGPPTLWGDVPGDELAGFLTYTTGTPRTRAERSAAAKKSLDAAVDRAKRNATGRRRRAR